MRHSIIALVLGAGLALFATLPDSQIQQSAVASDRERCVFREANPAGQALANMTGNMTSAEEPSIPAASPAGLAASMGQLVTNPAGQAPPTNITGVGGHGNVTGNMTGMSDIAGVAPGRGPQDKFLTDEPGLDG